jgi:DNA repair exonuclease SbcCD ATPase subunit
MNLKPLDHMKKSIIFAFTLLLGGSFLFSEKPVREKPDKGSLTNANLRPKFPLHWGKPPAAQTKDLVDLPGRFGKGSSTLANWIKENISNDIEKGKKPNVKDDLADKEKADPRKIERDILDAVKEGKISKEEARKKLNTIREELAQKGDRKRPQRPQKPEISEEVKAKIDAVKESEKALHKEIKAKIEGLGKEATREEIKATVEAFKENNKNRFEEIKEAHAAIKEDINANRPDKPERPELTEELKVKVEALHSSRKEMHEAQKELHKNLKDASKEDRKELITAFKEANKAKHEEIKTQAKEVKEEIRALVETEATRTSDL